MLWRFNELDSITRRMPQTPQFSRLYEALVSDLTLIKPHYRLRRKFKLPLLASISDFYHHLTEAILEPTAINIRFFHPLECLL